jgi:hypothetical protein
MAKVSPMADSSGLNSSVNINDLVGLFLGKSGSTTGNETGTSATSGSSTDASVSTTTGGLTQEAIQAMFAQALQASGGLASVASGQAGNGLYNSSTNQLMQNDLVSRVAGQVLSKNTFQTTANTGAKTVAQNGVTTDAKSSSTKTDAQVNPAKAAAAAGALSAMPQSWKDAILGKLGVGSAGSKPSSGGSSSSKPGAGVSTSSSTPKQPAGATASSANSDNNANAPTEKDVQDAMAREGASSSSAVDSSGVDGTSTSVGTMSDYGIGMDTGLDTTADAGGDTDYSGDMQEIDYGGGQDAGADVGGYSFDDFIDYSGNDGAYDDSSNDSYVADNRDDDYGFAGGGQIRDPNNMGNSVSSNLDFSQHNHVAMAVAQALGVGFANGGMVDSAVKSITRGINSGGVQATSRTVDESGRRHANTDQRVPESAKADMPAYGYDGLTVGDIEQLRKEKARLATYADGGNVFQRRVADLDAQTDAAVNGTSTQTAQPAAQPASAPAPAVYQSKPHPIMDKIVKALRFSNGGPVLHFDDGGKVDLTNLGLRIANSGSGKDEGVVGLAAQNSADDESASTDDVVGPTDQGTGFANTAQLTTTSKDPVADAKAARARSAPASGKGNIFDLKPAPTKATLPPDTKPKDPASGDSATGTTANAAASSIGVNVGSFVAPVTSGGMSTTSVSNPSVNDKLGITSSTPSGPQSTTANTGTSTNDLLGIVQIAANVADTNGAGQESTGDELEGSDDTSSDFDSNGDAGSGDVSGGNDGGGDAGSGGEGGDGTGDVDPDTASGKMFALGGAIFGAGDETSDSIPAKLSNNEFVMNAAATSRYRPFLEMLNNSVRAK